MSKKIRKVVQPAAPLTPPKAADAKTVDELLNTAERWCKRGSRDANNEIVYWGKPEVVKWCLMDAIYKVYGYTKGDELCDVVRTHLGITKLAIWNDLPATTFEDVRKVINDVKL